MFYSIWAESSRTGAFMLEKEWLISTETGCYIQYIKKPSLSYFRLPWDSPGVQSYVPEVLLSVSPLPTPGRHRGHPAGEAVHYWYPRGSSKCPQVKPPICLKFFFFKDFLKFILFMAVLGLRFCARAFSSCGLTSGGHSSSRRAGLSLSRPLLLRTTGSRRAGSVIVAHGPSCSAACGIFSDQGSNPCPLHWQADSQPLCHQGSPCLKFWSSKLRTGRPTGASG